MSTSRPLPLLALLAILPVLPAAEPAAVPPLPTAAAPAAEAAAAPATGEGSDATKAPAAKAKSKLLPSALAQASTVTVPLSPRFRQMRERIAVLFHDRIEPPPPPDPRFNPFRSPGAAAVPAFAPPDAEGNVAAAPAVTMSSDLAVLQQAIGMLRVRGTVERAGRLQLTINAGPGRDGTYKEGDILTLIVQDQPVHLRVRQITRYSVMFSLRDAELTLKF